MRKEPIKVVGIYYDEDGVGGFDHRSGLLVQLEDGRVMAHHQPAYLPQFSEVIYTPDDRFCSNCGERVTQSFGEPPVCRNTSCTIYGVAQPDAPLAKPEAPILPPSQETESITKTS